VILLLLLFSVFLCLLSARFFVIIVVVVVLLTRHDPSDLHAPTHLGLPLDSSRKKQVAAAVHRLPLRKSGMEHSRASRTPPNPLCCEEITCLDGCTEPNSAANRRADFDRYWKATATASVSPTTPALFGINRFFYRQPTNHTNRLTLLQENSTPPQRRHASPPETPVKKAASWWSPWTEYLLLLAIPYLIFRK